MVLNVDKTKLMYFSRSCSKIVTANISTTDAKCIELVSSYTYLGIWLDEKLSFKTHFDNLVKRLKVKLGFYFRNKSCFNFAARKKLVLATFLPMIDYGDVRYMHASAATLQAIGTVYHGAICYITNAKSLTNRCH